MKKINLIFSIFAVIVLIISCNDGSGADGDETAINNLLIEDLIGRNWRVNLPNENNTTHQYLRVYSGGEMFLEAWTEDLPCYDYTKKSDSNDNITVTSNTKYEYIFKQEYSDYDYSIFTFKRENSSITYSHYNYYREEEFDLVPTGNIFETNTNIDNLEICGL